MEPSRRAGEKLRETLKGSRTMKFMGRSQKKYSDRTPSEIATDSFGRALDKLNVDVGLKSVLTNDIRTIETIRFMNMKVLAATSLFMYNKGIKNMESIDNAMQQLAFTSDSMDEYVNSILPREAHDSSKIKAGDLIVMKIDIMNEMVTYMLVILGNREKMLRLQESKNQRLRAQIIEREDQLEYENDEGSDESLGPDEDEEEDI